MSQNVLKISWKDPVNRGAVLSVIGISLLTQALAAIHAIFIYQLGTSIEELIFVGVVTTTLAIVLAIIVLTGFEYLNENRSELKYRNISGVAIIVLIVFIATYSWGFEVLKGILVDLAATPPDLAFLISQGIGLCSVYVVFSIFHYWNKFTSSMKL